MFVPNNLLAEKKWNDRENLKTYLIIIPGTQSLRVGSQTLVRMGQTSKCKGVRFRSPLKFLADVLIRRAIVQRRRAKTVSLSKSSWIALFVPLSPSKSREKAKKEPTEMTRLQKRVYEDYGQLMGS